jgi:hypothetical protein
MLTSAKRLVRSAMGDKLVGVVDYYRFPEERDVWGGPFNGQVHRQDLVRQLFAALDLRAVVETGTHRGTTTAFLADTAQVPVWSVEHDERFFGYSSARLRKHDGVTLIRADSRSALRQLADDDAVPVEGVFFYLDAHWGEDLPVVEELDLVFGRWGRALAYIDDFRVEGDAGYGFDVYAPDKALTLDYIRPVVERFDLSVFFPAVPSEEETGVRRGSVLLADDPATVAVLGDMDGLRRYQR